MDEVELFVNGKSLGRKAMPKNGHLSWDAVYQPGKVKAVGYKNGKKALERTIETTGAPARLSLEADRQAINADGTDVAVLAVGVLDKKGRMVPDADIDLNITVDGDMRILGVGNGNPTFQAKERPTDGKGKTFTVKTFNGLAQILVQAGNQPGGSTVTVTAEGVAPATITLAGR